MAKILHEKVIFEDSLILEKGKITDGRGSEFERLRIKRQDAACVLVLNTDSDRIILTRQFRYGAAPKTDSHLIEIVAGKVDEGEDATHTAVRETEEETGYRVRKENLHYLMSCFSTPAYSSERYHIFFATVTTADRQSTGGGLEAENESIEIVELERSIFKEMILSGKLADAKTYVAGQHALLKNLL